MKKLFVTILTQCVLQLSKLRYKYIVNNLENISNQKKDQSGILFLPNHPALIDPVLLVCLLQTRFSVRPLADEHQINLPVVKQICDLFGTLPLPNLERRATSDAVEGTKKTLSKLADHLKNGENILLYPSGRIKRSQYEELGANSAVEFLIKNVPQLRIVLIRQNGLWGSRFSYGYNAQNNLEYKPNLLKGALNSLKVLFLNLGLFTPKRTLTYDFSEALDFKNHPDRSSLNRWLESFYNQNAQPNTLVNDYFWQKPQVLPSPEPHSQSIQGDIKQVSPLTQELVFKKLYEMSGVENPPLKATLSSDLGLDSLAIADLQEWISSEFGFNVGSPEALKTIQDILLAASGMAASHSTEEIMSAPPLWKSTHKNRLILSDHTDICSSFLAQAKKNPKQLILADSTGPKSFNDIILALHLITPLVKNYPGQYIGILMPASPASAIFYLAVLFAKKTPVMINWTVGARNLKHATSSLNIQKIITSNQLLQKLEAQNLDLSEIKDKFEFAENFAKKFSLPQKIIAKLKTTFSWADLENSSKHNESETAVVLFTSGSEQLPKAVPLSHKNILSNLKDLTQRIPLTEKDVLIGILPAFHSFGLTVTTILPIISGLKTIYHPNPTESRQIAQKIKFWGVSLLVGTPTFLAGILRSSKSNDLDSLELAVTGAEKCPYSLWEDLKKVNPNLKIIEGYGITECSPIVCVNDWENPHFGSIGKPLPSIDFIIVSPETNEVLNEGETGLLYLSGPNIFEGYLNYDGASPFIEHSGKKWYNTGDLVKKDAENRIFFEGRLKRFIKIGGEMVSLPAIEQVLLGHLQNPNEATSLAVEAIGTEESKEVVLFTTQNIERADANQIIRESGLSAIHNIKKVIQVPEIPLLGTGKINYRALKEQF